MLLFLNIDCVLAPPADALGPHCASDTGVRRLEEVMHAWPALRLVITSDRRYRMTLEHFRAFFAARFRHRLIATTSLYSRHQHTARRTREDEVLEWLGDSTCDHTEWLALDRCTSDYVIHADRLLSCETFTSNAVAELHAALLGRTPATDLAFGLPLDGSQAPDRPFRPSKGESCSSAQARAVITPRAAKFSGERRC